MSAVRKDFGGASFGKRYEKISGTAHRREATLDLDRVCDLKMMCFFFFVVVCDGLIRTDSKTLVSVSSTLERETFYL